MNIDKKYVPPAPPRNLEDDIFERRLKPMTKLLLIKMISCIFLSLYFVFFMWNIWFHGVDVLGINAFIFLLCIFLLMFYVLEIKGKFHKKDLIWVLPLISIPFSFLIYENPFIKVVNIFVYPILFGMFFNFGFLDDKWGRYWNLNFLNHFVGRFFSFFREIGISILCYGKLISPFKKDKDSVLTRVLMGIVLFLAVALTVIVPLLSSADSVFKDKMEIIYQWISDLFALDFFPKIIVFVILSIVLLAIVLAWSMNFNFSEKKSKVKMVDPVVSGIVLGGIFCLYLLFIILQANHILLGALPFDFDEAVSMVKSGFWQLFFLSILNILIYFFTYKKTVNVVQWILTMFTIASSLLLISAGHRMFLYVTGYGFSYEKFFASYTVLYCGILFIWMIISLFKKQKSNVLKFVIFLFLWMYAIITVLPIEQFIFRTNIKLSERENTKIRLYEMTMLSSDVLSIVKKYENEGKLKEKRIDKYDREFLSSENKKEFDWTPWIEKQEEKIENKYWFEYNMMNIIYKINP